MAVQTVVERASHVDLPDLVQLMHDFYAESNYPLDRPWAGRSFEALLQHHSRGGAWIARQGPESVGYVVLTLRHGMETGGVVGFIDDFFVVARARRNGNGSGLLAAVFQACRELDVAAVQVEVGSENSAANAIYAKFGLIDEGRILLTARLDKPHPRGEE